MKWKPIEIRLQVGAGWSPIYLQYNAVGETYEIRESMVRCRGVNREVVIDRSREPVYHGSRDRLVDAKAAAEHLHFERPRHIITDLSYSGDPYRGQ